MVGVMAWVWTPCMSTLPTHLVYVIILKGLRLHPLQAIVAPQLVGIEWAMDELLGVGGVALPPHPHLHLHVIHVGGRW